jgi:hypothetical protein
MFGHSKTDWVVWLLNPIEPFQTIWIQDYQEIQNPAVHVKQFLFKTVKIDLFVSLQKCFACFIEISWEKNRTFVVNFMLHKASCWITQARTLLKSCRSYFLNLKYSTPRRNTRKMFYNFNCASFLDQSKKYTISVLSTL